MSGKRVAHNKLTSEKVLEQFKQVHGDDFGYDNVVYVNTHTKVEIYCKKHDLIFHQTPHNHKEGSRCPVCGRESQIESARKSEKQFIEDAVEKYGHRDTYDKVEYVNNKTEIIVTCKIHGDYTTRPDLYLNGSICKSCRKRITKKGYSKYSDKDLFKEAGIKIFGDVTDYSKVGSICKDTKVELQCKKHDHDYIISVANHLGGQKCPKCAMENYNSLRMKTTEQYIAEAKEVHGDNCDYTDTVYKGSDSKLKIKCNKHNIFFDILPANHLTGTRCRKCFSENQSQLFKGKEGTCGYTKTGYINQANGREARVYLIKCFNEDEEFYKIGKTFLEMNIRFKKSNLSYNYMEVHSIYGEAGYIYDLENELHRKYKDFKHKPKIYFAGYTECFNLELPIEEIINL